MSVYSVKVVIAMALSGKKVSCLVGLLFDLVRTLDCRRRTLSSRRDMAQRALASGAWNTGLRLLVPFLVPQSLWVAVQR